MIVWSDARVGWGGSTPGRRLFLFAASGYEQTRLGETHSRPARHNPALFDAQSELG